MSPGYSAFEAIHSSHLRGTNAALVSLKPDEQKFTSENVSYYLLPGIITCTCTYIYMAPLSSTLNISPGLTSRFTLQGFDRTCVHVLVCVARWSRRELGESNLSHRGAETGE